MSLYDVTPFYFINFERNFMPKTEKIPASKANAKKAMTPIYSTLNGKLKIPVPMALANNVKIAPRKEPSLIGENVLEAQDLLVCSF
jgi:hypothetical protein